MPDFTRYAKNPKSVFWTQAVGLCVLVTLSGILGVAVTSATQQIYGVVSTFSQCQLRYNISILEVSANQGFPAYLEPSPSRRPLEQSCCPVLCSPLLGICGDRHQHLSELRLLFQ